MLDVTAAPTLHDLERVTGVLRSSGHPGELRAAARALHDLLVRVTRLQVHATAGVDAADILLAHGTAIAPRSAAACVLDFARTTAFLRGTEGALRAALARFPERPIEMLYAGCGPFAPFALMLATQFDPAEVRITLLDVNPRSLDCARRVFEGFGLRAFVRDAVCVDAAAYAWPHAQPLHVVLTETMQRALEKEPQVAVTLNLAPQLCEGGILVPERIAVDLCLFDPAREFPALDGNGEPAYSRVRVPLGEVFALTAASARALAAAGAFPVVEIDVPPDSRHQLATLRTRIAVFGEHVLDEYASGITNPLLLNDFAGARHIRVQYASGPQPAFHCERVDG